MFNFGKKNLPPFLWLNSFYIFWAQLVSGMQEFYVSTVRFCALILEILWKIYVTEFSYRRYHGSWCIDACDCINGEQVFQPFESVKEQNPDMNMP